MQQNKKDRKTKPTWIKRAESASIDVHAAPYARVSLPGVWVPHSVVPDVLDDGSPCIRWAWNPRGYQSKPDSRECLFAFMQLHDAEDDPTRVVAFARRWGVLELCEHRTGTEQLPAPPWGGSDGDWCEMCRPLAVTFRNDAQLRVWHLEINFYRDAGDFAQAEERLIRIKSRLTAFQSSPETARRVSALQLSDVPLHRERVAAWVHCARTLRAIVAIVADLRTPSKSGVLLDEWTLLCMPNQAWESDEQKWMRLTDVLNYWVGTSIHAAGEPFLWDVREDDLTVAVNGTLRARLALQLVSVLRSKNGTWRCDQCGDPHRRERAPKLTQDRVLCPNCQRGEKAEKARVDYQQENPVARRTTKYRKKPEG
jgi:hypothetical protein